MRVLIAKSLTKDAAISLEIVVKYELAVLDPFLEQEGQLVC